MTFDDIVEKATKCIKSQTQIGNETNPRFLAFTAPSSICSEKVRCVLSFKQIDYINYNVDLFSFENYHPNYVEMRALGWNGGSLVGDHDWTGSTSAASFGFDPLVVPTLVDMKEKRVVVDSKKIIEYIEKVIPNPSLYNQSHNKLIEKHVDLVDDTPHAGILYGGDPDNDFLPPILKYALFGVNALQQKSLNKWLNDKSLPASIAHFYEAKLKKCKNVGHTIQNDPEKLRKGIQETRRILAELDRDLEKSKGTWICDNCFTMADLVWHVSLLRLLTFGCGYLTEPMPRVEAYRDRLLSHPRLKTATYTWPGFIPSPNLTTLLWKEGTLAQVERNRALIVLLGFKGGLFLGVKELVKYVLSGTSGVVSLGVIATILAYKRWE